MTDARDRATLVPLRSEGWYNQLMVDCKVVILRKTVLYKYSVCLKWVQFVRWLTIQFTLRGHVLPDT